MNGAKVIHVQFGRGGHRLRTDVEKREAAHALYAKASLLDEDRETFHEAEKLYLRALELYPGFARATVNLANILHRWRGKYKEAEELYRRALVEDPDLPEAHYNLARVLDRRDPQAAIFHYTRSIDLDPSFTDPMVNLAFLYELTGANRKAAFYWQLYLKLEPEGANAPNAVAFLKMHAAELGEPVARKKR